MERRNGGDFMRIILRIVLVLLAFSCFHFEAQADEEIPLEVIRGTETETIYLTGLTGDTTYIPVKDLSQAINIPYTWLTDTGSVAWSTHQQVTVITPGITTVYILTPEGIREEKSMQKAVNYQGKAYVSLKMLEMIGVEVIYDAGKKTRMLVLPENLNNNYFRPEDAVYQSIKEKIINEKKIEEQKSQPKAQGNGEIPLKVQKGIETEIIYLKGLTGNSTYIPVKDLSQAIGIPYTWLTDTGSVAWSTNGQVTIITPGIDTVYILTPEGVKEVKSGQQAKIHQGRSYVSLRMLEIIGVKVVYDAGQKTSTLILPGKWNNNFQPEDAVYKSIKEKIIKEKRVIEEKKKQPKKIGSFTTTFDPNKVSRTTNLKLAANAINNRKIAPGEVFSFNKTVGPRIPERGYKKAIIFMNKQEVEGYGGGVCQVSTTLYNAVLKTGLPIVERHMHSLPVSYIAKGRDATVSYGSADFRFKNNTKSTIIIRTQVQGGKLTVELLSLTN
jgi:hypothetical protein